MYVYTYYMRTTIAIYSRVSTKDKGQDTENQLRQLRDFCAKQGYEIVHEYVDYEMCIRDR